ncbi:MAG: Flp pilus assembly protein CpaB, partial [Hyphomicrobiaceae bacterium]
WANWPADAVSKTYITKKEKPMAIQELAGGVARSTINKDEPITNVKFVSAGQGGVLAAILPKGKRAVSTKIADATAAGRLILPNDHVDVLVTVERAGRFDTTTLLRNIRVLAIGKQLDVSNKEKGANGNVATLELTPRQAEQMALANSMGRISLALRSVADIQADKGQNENKPERSEQSTSVQIFQYGIKGRAY